MIAVDTNVLIYACDQAEPRRQKVALDLVTNSSDGVLLWQVAWPNAGVIGEPGMDYSAGSDEFGGIRFTTPPTKDYKIGDKLEVIVPHCDPVVNEYDEMYGIRQDRVEVVWQVTGRGKSQ